MLSNSTMTMNMGSISDSTDSNLNSDKSDISKSQDNKGYQKARDNRPDRERDLDEMDIDGSDNEIPNSPSDSPSDSDSDESDDERSEERRVGKECRYRCTR